MLPMFIFAPALEEGKLPIFLTQSMLEYESVAKRVLMVDLSGHGIRLEYIQVISKVVSYVLEIGACPWI